MTFPSSGDFASLIQDAAAAVDQEDLRGILRRVADTARRATGAKYGALGVLGLHGSLSDFVHAGMSDEQADRIGRLPVGKGVLGTIIRHPEPIMVEDVSAHPDYSGFPEHHPTMRSFLGVPVRAGDEIFGNLYLTEKKGGFVSEDMETANALAAIAGGAVSSTRMHQRLALVAVIEDRERIARDLHDAVIQDLFATGLSLQALTMARTDDAVTVRIRDAVERIDESIEALRNFIFNLRRMADETPTTAETLERAIRRLCGRVEELELDLRDLGGLPPHTFDAITGLVREAVSNACRHSGCTKVSVTTQRSGSALEVVVSDNGTGFEGDQRRRGMGLDNMHKRIESGNGSISIDSIQGRGTVVRALIPV